MPFLQLIDSSFTPHLSEKVNLLDWSDKVFSQASTVACYDDGVLVGLLVFYCNDSANRRSYISLLGVSDKHRGKGYARKMLERAISYIKELHFAIVGVHSNNPLAIALYRSVGFEVVGEAIDNRYYLELTL